jgi:heat shock protein HslJ
MSNWSRRSVLGAAVALSACAAQTPPPSDTSVPNLAGTSWRRVDDMNANPHGATITFSIDDRASGSTGCNRWFSAVTRQGNALQFGNMGMTRMACADVQNGTERSFTEMMPRVRAYRMDGEELVFLDETGTEIARFVTEVIEGS